MKISGRRNLSENVYIIFSIKTPLTYSLPYKALLYGWAQNSKFYATNFAQIIILEISKLHNTGIIFQKICDQNEANSKHLII